MGCEESNLANLTQIRISIIDSSFMKPTNKKIWEALAANHIVYESYISITCFLEEFAKKYTKYIVASEENYETLVNGLKEAHISPYLFVMSAKPSAKSIELQKNSYPQSQFVNNYDIAIETLTKKRASFTQIKQGSKKKMAKIDLKILRNITNEAFSESMIFEETMKVKQIKFEKFDSFQALEDSLKTIDSDFIVTDYSYHREVVNLVRKSATKVICFCNLDEKQGYDPDIFFITNNFQEIANQINQEKNLKNFVSVPCTKAFIYSSLNPQFYKYGRILSKFNIQLKKCNNLSDLLTDTKYYFCITLICAQDQKKNVENFLQSKGSAFRVKMISIPTQAQNSQKGLRKILKELKKGYKAQKGVTKSIDIIDKHNQSSKFDQIKAQLEKVNVGYFCYNDLSTYIKNLKFVSPYVICNFQEKSLLLRYLEQIKSKSKMIVFCNKNKITPGIVDGKRLVFISSHFGKILKYIRTNQVFSPVILNENNMKINQKQAQLKNKKQRISALKWGGSEVSNGQKREDNLSFINIDSEINLRTLKSIQNDNSSLWNFQGPVPLKSIEGFRKDLIDSLIYLKKLYKISFPQSQFAVLLEKVKTMNLYELMMKIKEFFESQNQFGIKINNSLRAIEKVNNEEIIHLREFIYLANLNFLSPYSFPKLGKIKLSHWTKEYLLQKCEVGSKLITKNFFIMYQNLEDLQNQSTSFHRIDVELEYNSLAQSDFCINSFFKHKGKYIFAPYSQFAVKAIKKELDVTVISLTYQKNVEFLKSYYQSNLLTNGEDVLSFFDKNMNAKSPLLINDQGRPKVERNISRLRALKYFRENNLSKAIQEQLATIKMQEQIEDFDSSKINQLNFQLASYYCKLENSEQAIKLIKELMQVSPGHFIVQECGKLMQKLHENVIKQPQGEGKRKMTEHIIQIEQMNHEESQSEQSDHQVIFDGQLQDQIQCLQVDDTFGKNMKEQTFD